MGNGTGNGQHSPAAKSSRTDPAARNGSVEAPATGIAARIFATAAGFNYPWELAQLPLYQGMGNWRANLLHCLTCSAIDGLLVLAIFGLGWMATRQSTWFIRPGFRGYFLILSSGLLTGIAVEIVGVHLIAKWTYAEAMPIIPVLKIGIVPILQMIVLPPAIFYAAGKWCNRTSVRK